MELCQVQGYTKQIMQGREEREPFKSQSELESVTKQEVLLWTRMGTFTSHIWKKKRSEQLSISSAGPIVQTGPR